MLFRSDLLSGQIPLIGWLKEVRSTGLLKEFVQIINPAVLGWINYYGKFCASELWGTVNYIDKTLIKWAKRKYGKLGRSWRKGTEWLNRIKTKQPLLFKHWQWMLRNDLDRRAV